MSPGLNRRWSAASVLVATLLIAGAGCSWSSNDAEAGTASAQLESESATSSQRLGSQAEATPPGIEQVLGALALPITVTVPDGTELASVVVSTSRDETGRLVHELDVEVTADTPTEELAQSLARNPVLPSRGIDIPLPTFDHFYDWSDPRVEIETDGLGSRATVITRTRRQSKGAGDPVLPGPLTEPLRRLTADGGLPMAPSSSTVRWRTERPNEIEATVGLTGVSEGRSSVTNWIVERSSPGTLEMTNTGAGPETMKAVLSGSQPVTVAWRKGSYRDTMSAELTFEIDADGHAVDDPELARFRGWATLIDWGATWRLDVDGVADDGWTALAFDDRRWRGGPAPLIRDEPGVPGTRVDTAESGTPIWLRHTFSVDDPSDVGELTLSLVADDGALVYLNGVELARWNLPEGPIDARSLALDRISGPDEEAIRVIDGFSASNLVRGENVLAVAVLQSAPDSSDIRFDLQLKTRPAER